MAEDPEPTKNEADGATPPATSENKPETQEDVGDFITRHVLEKDSVFFEG